MVGPIDAVVAIHNAFRADMAAIDAAALAAARGVPGLEATVERFRFFNEVLAWHAHGEEVAVFTALEEVAPLVAEAYEMDHRGLDLAFDTLSNAVSARDALADRACDRRVQVPSRHSPREGRHAPVSHHPRACLAARPGRRGGRHGRRGSPGPQPRTHRVDVPAARRRRPENMTRVGRWSCHQRCSWERSSSSTRRSPTTSRN